jgi:CheY-like chemotaxis protein
MPETVESQALQQAVQIFGSVGALSQWLRVPSDTLTDWITGNGVPPRDVFLQVTRLLREPDPRGAIDASPSLGLRVVIVAAERDTLMTLGILLRSEGCEVRLLSGAADVAKAVREFRPHAVFLDLGMPERVGYEIATELTREHGSARPYLIAVTAQASEPDIESCGFHHQLSRPYNPDALISLLASLPKSA